MLQRNHEIPFYKQNPQSVFCKWLTQSQTSKTLQLPYKISCFDCSQDGKYIVLAFFYPVVIMKIYDIQLGLQVGSDLIGHQNFVIYAKYSPDGQLIASRSDDSTIRLWNTQSQDQVQQIDGKDATCVDRIDFSSDSNCVISAHQHFLKFWCCSTGQLRHLIKLETSLLCFKYFKNTDRQWIQFSQNGNIHIYDLQQGRNIKKLRGRAKGITSLQQSGYNIINIDNDMIIRIWSIKNSKQIRKLIAKPADIQDISELKIIRISPKNNKIISRIGSEIRIWDIRTAKNRIVCISYFPEIRKLHQISPDGRFVIFQDDQDCLSIIRLFYSIRLLKYLFLEFRFLSLSIQLLLIIHKYSD